jgi:glutamate racemase
MPPTVWREIARRNPALEAARPVGDNARRVAGTDGAIGIFDSGVGGLTVLHALLGVLPREDLVYLGDTGRYPYGTKSAETVTRYSIENVEFLVARGIKLLVVACNTASAVALRALEERFALPIVGVIEPGARAAVARTRSGRVGVIGTEGTIASGEYTRRRSAASVPGSRSTRVRARSSCRSRRRAGSRADPARRRGDVSREPREERHRHARARLHALSPPEAGDRRGDGRRRRARRLGGGDGARVATVVEERGLARRDGAGSTSFFVTDVPDRFIHVGQRFLGARVHSAVRVER